MRHKILDCIGTFMGTGDVDGVVEMDEPFVAESFNGNYKKVVFQCQGIFIKEVNKLKNVI